MQQVVLSGHALLSGQITSFFGMLILLEGIFVCHGMESVPLLHMPAWMSHVVPSGQQWEWSLQHTACVQNTYKYLVTYKTNEDCL